MERSLTEGRVAPIGWGRDGVLGFVVFVAASEEDERLRASVNAAVERINRREPHIKLTPRHYREDAVMPTNGDVQAHIEGSMGGSDTAQITIGLIGVRLGDGTKEEILKALNADAPSPALFVFHPRHILGLGELEDDHDKAEQRIAEHKVIRAFVSEIERSGAERGEKRRCIAFKESELEETIWNQLQHYVHLWSVAASTRAAPVSGTATTAPKAAPSRPHYRGLKPYRPEDAPYFFGREEDIKRLTDVLRAPHVQSLHLKGGSGVGKSSLVLAGLLPRIAGGPELRSVIVFKPGTNPFLALARAIDERRPSTMQTGEHGHAALAERLQSSDAAFCEVLAKELANILPSARRIIYVDQLEELLLLSPETDAAQKRRQVFAVRLCAFLSAEPRNTLLTSIRIDRDDLLGSPTWRALGRRIAEGRQEWIYAPEIDEALPAIVRGPAELAHLDVDPRLVKALRADVQSLANWPPLLGAALEEIALRWEATPEAERRAVLTLDHYRAVGGLAAVIGQRTRTVTDSLTDAHRTEVLPQLFPLLVRLDDRGRPTKRRFPKSRFGSDTPESQVLELLINGRLLVDEGEVELGHDLLFEVWAELAAWITRYGEDLDELSEIEHQARRWVRRKAPDLDLLAQDRLERAERALRAHPLRAKQMPELQDFVNKSRTLRDQSALVAALSSGNLDVLPELLKREVVLDDKHLGILRDNHKLVFYYALFPARIPKEEKNDEKRPPTSIAAGFKEAGDSKENDPWLEMFTAENTRDHVSNNFTVQHFAAFAGRVDVLKRLRDIGADLMSRSDRGSTPLAIAAGEGQLETVEWLVSQSTDQADQLKERGTRYPLLHRAALYGSQPMVQYLLDRGADVHEVAADGWTALQSSLATAAGARVARLLIEAGAHVDLPGPNSSPLLLAVQLQDRALIELILGRGANVETETSEKWRALGAAIAKDVADAGIVQLLLEAGANPDAPNGPDVVPPIALAAERGYVEIIGMLLGRGANVNAPTGAGFTPLIRAAYHGAEPVVRSLLGDPHVDLEAVDRQGQTALAWALQTNQWRTALTLLEAGAKVPPTVSSAVFERIANSGGGRIDPVRSALIDRLIQAGSAFPPFKQWARDEDGQIEGLVPKPMNEVESWFSGRLAEPYDEDPWRIASLLDGQWTAIAAGDATRLLARAATTCPALVDFPWTKARFGGIRSRPFAVYPSGALYEVSVCLRDGEIGYLTLMDAADRLTAFDGVSAPVHDLNANVALDLSNGPDAADYLRLFCGVVCGDEGNFTIVERPEQLHVLATITDEKRTAALDLVSPLRLEGEGRDDRQRAYFDFAARVKYGNALFSSRFRVLATGEVEMTEDEPALADLAAKRELFGAGPLRILVEPS